MSRIALDEELICPELSIANHHRTLVQFVVLAATIKLNRCACVRAQDMGANARMVFSLTRHSEGKTITVADAIPDTISKHANA